MATTREKIVSVDGRAARQAIADTGRAARKAASRKASEGARAAGRKVNQTGKKAAQTIAGRAASARRYVGDEIGRRKNSALQTALKTCIELSDRQLAALKKLESSIARH